MKSKKRSNAIQVLKYARTLLVLAIVIFVLMPQPFAASYDVKIKPVPLVQAGSPSATYDVIVVGTDPEGITAAVSAARNGLKTLLVEPRKRNRLGGLMTLGGLNSLDMNKSPVVKGKYPEKTLNKGIYQEWYEMIEGTSFDVNRAANAFQKLVQDEKNIDLLMNAKVTPVLEGSKVVGMNILRDNGKPLTVRAGAVIDATQDADVAAAAGVPFTLLREDLGEPSDNRIAVTLVFKIAGVTDDVWQAMRNYPGVGSDSRSIWGYSNAREYPSSNPDRVRIRSLNIGRQDDNTILLNTMQIYGIDPLDPASLEEGIKIGTKEAPLIVDYLKKKYKPFRNVTYAGVASELYVRESRHIVGEYRLTIADLMENRDFPDAIAYGSYEVDIQGSSTSNPGSVTVGSILMIPEQYGVPFRTLVPKRIDGLLVVGRSASFDTLPHGSARVIPLGMATGEAAGAAAKLAKDKNKSLRELSRSSADMKELRDRLTKQGMDLRMRPFAKPEYMKHKNYEGLLAAVSIFATVGGYDNKAWALDEPSNPKRFANVYRKLQKKYPSMQSKQDIATLLNADSANLRWEDAAYAIARASDRDVSMDQASDWLIGQGWIRKQTVKDFADPNKLTNGEAFMIIRDLAENVAGAKIH
ncbi:FAD-dependent oxidoreductase [Cohnella panacarvi]|uniref:FAD-dependent oxidoreductase n=1 Tax=Cohnella panacarvi TaxID=400776 RepID=UPI00047ECC29|nr:FAD-dependent oxidoreductase [Cohnella panacarvi]